MTISTASPLWIYWGAHRRRQHSSLLRRDCLYRRQ